METHICAVFNVWEGKNIDFAIDQMLEEVTINRFENADDLLSNIGNHYQCRFHWFGIKIDLDSAIEDWVETVPSIPLNSTVRLTVLTSLFMPLSF